MISLALVLMFGCSTYKGQKYATIVDNKPQYVAPTGIPFALTRPEYTLARTPPAEGQKLPTYTLGVTYEPDPSHKYTLKINPGIFADPNFTVKLAAGGTLQATTVTFTEQITPTITTLGQFTASIIGALAVAAVLDKTSLRQEINSGITSAKCNSESDVPALCVDNIGPSCPLPEEVGSAIKKRIDAFKSDDEFVELFHYVTEKEHLCLEAAAKELKQKLSITKEDVDKKKNKWIEKREAYLKDKKDDSKAWDIVNRLTLAVINDDRKAFEELKSEIKNEVADEEKKHKRGPASEKNELIVNAQEAAESQTQYEAQPKLDFFVKMDIPTWFGRHLLYLEREIEKTETFALRHPKLTDPQKAQIKKFISTLRRQRAAAIGALDLHDRSVVLSEFIEKIRDKPVFGGTAPATSEYATARAELDTVLLQIEARRTRVLASAKPPPPPQAPPLKITNVKRVSSDEIKKLGPNGPDYVLVLKEVE
jgi:hypothetical protein